MGFLSKFTDLFRPEPSNQVPPKLPDTNPKIDWQQRKEDPGKFVYEEDGFTYPFNDSVTKIKWTDIERISAYKADRFTYDTICMKITSGGLTWTLNEDTPGWYQLLKRLADVFPSIPKEWDWDIVQPPFATHYTILYEREDRILPESTNFYCFLRSKDPQSVLLVFPNSNWHVRKSGWTEWELISTWAELNLDLTSDGLLLNGLVAFHPNNITQLDQLLDKVGVYYQYEYYDEQKNLLLALPQQ